MEEGLIRTAVAQVAEMRIAEHVADLPTSENHSTLHSAHHGRRINKNGPRRASDTASLAGPKREDISFL
jgi:hypothetical protein